MRTARDRAAFLPRGERSARASEPSRREPSGPGRNNLTSEGAAAPRGRGAKREDTAGASWSKEGPTLSTWTPLVPNLALGWLDLATGMRSATEIDIADGPLVSGASGMDPGLLIYYALVAESGLHLVTVDVTRGTMLFDVPADRTYSDLYVLTPAGPI